tara:strand:- start:408 stop:650 length:243 start_codon:yes stop_codon:yes gene_type:complete
MKNFVKSFDNYFGKNFKNMNILSKKSEFRKKRKTMNKKNNKNKTRRKFANKIKNNNHKKIKYYQKGGEFTGLDEVYDRRV